MSRLWVWALLGVSVLGACSSDDPSAYEQGVADVCHGACVGWQRCGLSGSNCESNCVANYDPHGIRGESLSVIGDCLKTEDCTTLESDEAFHPCFDQARESEPLRDGLLTYCEEAAKTDFDCNIWWSVEDCTHTMGLWNDDVLKSAAGCFKLGCDALQDCEKSTFEHPP